MGTHKCLIFTTTKLIANTQGRQGQQIVLPKKINISKLNTFVDILLSPNSLSGSYVYSSVKVHNTTRGLGLGLGLGLRLARTSGACPVQGAHNKYRSGDLNLM